MTNRCSLGVDGFLGRGNHYPLMRVGLTTRAGSISRSRDIREHRY